MPGSKQTVWPEHYQGTERGQSSKNNSVCLPSPLTFPPRFDPTVSVGHVTKILVQQQQLRKGIIF